MIETATKTFPSDEWAKTTCKIGQGAACCRYLTMGGGGWSCAKHSSLKTIIDKRVADDDFVARGDNCAGLDAR